MTAFICPARWLAQPRYPVELDRSHVLAQGLAGLWHPLWWNARNAAGQAQGVLTGNCVVTRHSIGQAWTFDGNGDYVQVAGYTAPQNNFTAGVLANVTNTTSPRCLISARANTGWVLAANNTGYVEYYAEGSGWQSSGLTPQAGTWQLMGVTDRGAAASTDLYVGKRVDAGNATNTGTPKPVTIGAWDVGVNPTGTYMLGSIALAFVYARAVAPSAWNALAESPWQMFRPVPARMYSFSAAAGPSFKFAWARNANTVIGIQ